MKDDSADTNGNYKIHLIF